MRPCGQLRSSVRRAAALALAVGALGLAAACTASGTPSVAAPPSTVISTVTATTVVRSTSTVTATVTQTPTPTTTAAPAVLVAATFEDPSTFECNDATADWCWALDVTTTGPCPNGAYVSVNVYKNDGNDVVTVLEATSVPITDPLGGRETVQVSTSGVTVEGDTLRANLKEARCA